MLFYSSWQKKKYVSSNLSFLEAAPWFRAGIWNLCRGFSSVLKLHQICPLVPPEKCGAPKMKICDVFVAENVVFSFRVPRRCSRVGAGDGRWGRERRRWEPAEAERTARAKSFPRHLGPFAGTRAGENEKLTVSLSDEIMTRPVERAWWCWLGIWTVGNTSELRARCQGRIQHR